MPRRSSASPPPAAPGDPRARIHIVPVGFELERITHAIERERADRVYLVTRAGPDAGATFVDEVHHRLRKLAWPVDVRIVRTALWDTFAAVAEYRRIFEAERRIERRAPGVLPIRVNVSTGTKITAIAGTLACMLWNGEPYYVQVSRSWYSDRPPRARSVHDAVDRVDPVPVYELRAPGRDLVEVLEALERRGGLLRKRELIRELGLDRPGPGGGAAPSPQAQHGRLARRLDPLESKWGFVVTDDRGPRARVRLTDQGRVALTLFGGQRSNSLS